MTMLKMRVLLRLDGKIPSVIMHSISDLVRFTKAQQRHSIFYLRFVAGVVIVILLTTSLASHRYRPMEEQQVVAT
jgi:hypothetical protein